MKYITVIASVVFVLVFAATASAQTWVETRTYTTADSTTPRMDAWLSGKIAGTVGTFAWLQMDANYAEGYAGISLTPKPWLQFGIGSGLEDGKLGRTGSFVWVGTQKHSAIAIFEQGGSGAWWKAEYNYAVNRVVGVGLITERFKGTGLRVQVAVPHSPITIWAAPLVKEGKLAGIVGVRIKM